MFFTVSARESAASRAQEVSAPTGSGTPPATAPADPDSAQNLQDHKRVFMDRKPDAGIISQPASAGDTDLAL